jgi:uncharacterized membrane protein
LRRAKPSRERREISLRARVSSDSTEEVRLRLARWLALAIEFELAADIIRTMIASTSNDIGQLAAIIVIRTTLNFFLGREREGAEKPLETSAGAFTRGVG